MGKGECKSNTVDDFIAAAEFLVRNGYSSADKIIANGASNGGLTGRECSCVLPYLRQDITRYIHGGLKLKIIGEQ